MKVVSLIPIKTNNERLQNKNTKKLHNKPLCKYIFNTIKNIDIINEKYCFCSNENIKTYLPSEITFLKRDPIFNTNTTSMTDIIENFISKIDADIYILMHATSPFLKKKTIELCINKVLYEGYDSAFTGAYVKDFLWFNNKVLNYNLDNIPRTQDLQNAIKETSGIYIFKKDIFTTYKQRIGLHPYIHIVDYKESIDIDTIHDFKLAEFLIKDDKTNVKNIIKFVVFDFDGVFTNGKIYFNNNNSHISKCYNGKDSFSLKLLKKKNIKTGIITADTLDIVSNAYHIKDRIDKYSFGHSDKLNILHSWSKELNIELKNIAYIGDDLSDIPVLEHVGFSACPNDAIDSVKEKCDYICNNIGGNGCVREFVEKILKDYV